MACAAKKYLKDNTQNGLYLVQKMLRYVSLDITCSSKLTLLEDCLLFGTDKEISADIYNNMFSS